MLGSSSQSKTGRPDGDTPRALDRWASFNCARSFSFNTKGSQPGSLLTAGGSFGALVDDVVADAIGDPLPWGAAAAGPLPVNVAVGPGTTVGGAEGRGSRLVVGSLWLGGVTGELVGAGLDGLAILLTP
jgi:hypothetical protein